MLAFHDDLLEPTCVEKLCAVLDARPEVVLAFPDTRFTNTDRSEEHWQFPPLHSLETARERGLVMQGCPWLWWAPKPCLFRLEQP